MTRIAILRCGKLPSFVNWEVPNLDELFEEDKLLLQGFHTQAFQAQPVVWSRSDIDWNQFDIALIRSTWDYLDEQERFLQVLSQIETSSCRLFNPLAAVRWNIDKRYLFDLDKWGVPIIPTYLASHTEISTLHKLFVDRQVPTVILKPTIGLGGSHSYRVPLDELNHTLTTLRVNQPQREYLIQPFIESIVSEGEWSFVYFNRRLSHVLLKKPAPNDYRVQGIYGGTVHAVEPLARDLWQAEAVLAKLPFDLLYARLDFVRAGNDLAIMEVELIEPILGFNLVPESVVHLVNAIRVKFEKHP
jgi:glutathione synthase/RimK-type ligase-like ATP-grasp enzyme